jgi:hypothetical protein
MTPLPKEPKIIEMPDETDETILSRARREEEEAARTRDSRTSTNLTGAPYSRTLLG